MDTGNDDQVQENSDYILTCPECRSGVMRLQYITYFTWLDEGCVQCAPFRAPICFLFA